MKQRFLKNAIAAMSAIVLGTTSAFSLEMGKDITLNPGDSIQEALDDAKPGTTIYLKGGVYFEKIKFKRSGNKAQGPITLSSAPGEQAILDGEQTPPEGQNDQMIEIRNRSYITVQNLVIRNFRQSVVKASHAAIYVTGKGQDIVIQGNEIHDIKTELDVRGGNAHGIVVYGTESFTSLKNIKILENHLHDLMLGSSEALVLNGNVEHFSVIGNRIHDCDNIGIDVIGHEGRSPNPVVDQARNGLIQDNTVYNITSAGNPNYGQSLAANGIYVDGGKDIKIDHNTVYETDIGIEVASEHAGKSTSNVEVTGNTISHNRTSGISIGGYDLQRGSTVNCSFTNNILFENGTGPRGGSEISIQYYASKNVFRDNHLTSGPTNIFLSHRDALHVGEITFDHNTYVSAKPKKALFVWKGVDYLGLKAFSEATGLDAHSTMAKSSAEPAE